MFSIYNVQPAPWGDSYRLVETLDTEDDAKEVLASLEKVNISFNCYEIVEENYVQTNRQLRAEVKRQQIQLEEAANEINNLKGEILTLRSRGDT